MCYLFLIYFHLFKISVHILGKLIYKKVKEAKCYSFDAPDPMLSFVDQLTEVKREARVCLNARKQTDDK